MKMFTKHTYTYANMQLQTSNNEGLMKSAANCCKKNVSLWRPGVLYVMLMDQGFYIKLITMSFHLPPPQSLFSIFFFTSLVSSVRNPITVIKSVDPQRALVQTARERETHGGGEIWWEGKRWIERAQQL